MTSIYEVDEAGTNEWKVLKRVTVEPDKAANVIFMVQEKEECIQVKTDKTTKIMLSFTYISPDLHSLQFASNVYRFSTGYRNIFVRKYEFGNKRRSLVILANRVVDDKVEETGYCEMEYRLELIHKDDTETADFIREELAIPHQVIFIKSGLLLIIDDGRCRWRLPLSGKAYTLLTDQVQFRFCREVATECDLFSCMGIFYELPAEKDGYATIRSVSIHNYRITDYAFYRGMLVLTGVNLKEGKDNELIIVSDDGKAAVWVGVIDDLWQLGKPVGKGDWMEYFV